MKIEIIDPNTTLEMTRGIEEAQKLAARPDTEIVEVSPESGPASMESYYDEYLCIPGVFDEIGKGEEEGADAYVIACCGDPRVAGGARGDGGAGHRDRRGVFLHGLDARRAVLDRHGAAAHTHDARIDGVRVRDVPSCSEHPGFSFVRSGIEADPEGSWQMVRDDARRAVEEDDAEAVLLGCAGMAEFANSLEEELGVPVIDGVVYAVKFAESIVDLGKKTSKRKTYKPPEKKAFTGVMMGFGTG